MAENKGKKEAPKRRVIKAIKHEGSPLQGGRLYVCGLKRAAAWVRAGFAEYSDKKPEDVLKSKGK